MVFSSIIFIATFLPISLILYYITPKVMRNLILLLISLIFYAWGEPVYVLLMIFTTIFNFITGRIIGHNHSKVKKCKKVLIFTIIVDLLILGFFKYYGFFIENLNVLLNLNIKYSKLPLPLGISFYTFQTLSYVIDVYLGKVKSQKSLVSFGLYVAMFPQLVAGPIVRYTDIEKQINIRNESVYKFGLGVERFIKGLCKKVLLANNIGIVWTTIQSTNIDKLSVLTSWIGIIAYTFQIYFDFSGYSDMAIGLGKMFGFDFIENFNYPYISSSVSEFWRRWHISLGSWFKEYIYIPLGGNRVSKLKSIRNIFVVWMLTGLWHGASWNFIIWGIYYGIILFMEKNILKGFLQKAPKSIRHIYTMILVMIGWVLFGSENLSYALKYISVMFGISGNSFIDATGLYYLYTNLILLIVVFLCSTPIVSKIFENIIKRGRSKGLVIAAFINVGVIILSISYLINETYNPFLYFRF
ncbi:MBOAT family protein [Clostridium niameyense]|uniref:MBOAT family protein n=2 Tax=Clostridium niameyense TaxID=1622073 RepID=A0A6M0RAI5_9CLOT|nr:MBOAT family protein [Clostridium niameyense]NEZ47275.1 MBOAT family protein [Clostridium niameyense]